MAKINEIDITSLTFQEGAAPSTPAATKWKPYFKTTGLFVMDDAGAETGPLAPATGVSSGTSNPGTPASGDLFFRTDHGLMIYYDGTRWLDTNLQTITWSTQTVLAPASATATNVAMPNEQDFDWWLVDLHVAFNVLTTNDGTRFWTYSLVKNTAGTTIVSGNTSAAAASTWTKGKVAIDALLGTAVVSLDLSWVKTSTPGNLYFGGYITARRVVP